MPPIENLAHQVLAIGGLADATHGTSVTPTAMSAGTTHNTVPAAGEPRRGRPDVGCQRARAPSTRACGHSTPVLHGAALEVTLAARTGRR